MRAVRQRGGEVYVVGGAVRDWAWEPGSFNANTVDWDLTTNLSPDILEALAVSKHPGMQFGTFRLGAHVEVTIMRREGIYADHRHPANIASAAGIEDDLRRRDFTANAVAYDGSRVVASADALHDLRDRRLRTVGDPTLRFREDPLRMLRLLRFSGNYDRIGVDSKTWLTLLAMRDEVRLVSRERRLQEFVKFLKSPLHRWYKWHQAGMDQALEWSHGECAPSLDVAWMMAPEHPAARIAVYRMMTAGTCRGLDIWAQNWPLPRSWRAGLTALSASPDPTIWADLARIPYQRQAWMFRELAAAQGMDRSTLNVLQLAVSPAEIQKRWGISGAALGQVVRCLYELIAHDPTRNDRAQLGLAIETCAKSRQE